MLVVRTAQVWLMVVDHLEQVVKIEWENEEHFEEQKVGNNFSREIWPKDCYRNLTSPFFRSRNSIVECENVRGVATRMS